LYLTNDTCNDIIASGSIARRGAYGGCDDLRGQPRPSIRALQPQEEAPLQIRCRYSGLSYIEQPQVAGHASAHQTSNAPERYRKTNFGQSVCGRSATAKQKRNGDPSLMRQPEKGLIFPIVCFYVEMKRTS
jgi:hypothetical protein